MLRKAGSAQNVLTAVVFVLLETAALLFLHFSGPLQRSWIARGMQAGYGAIWGSTEAVKQYFALSKENARLSLENEILSMQLYGYKAAAQEYNYAASVGDTVARFHFIPAQVKKISSNKQHNYIILAKGSEDGVVPMSGVVTSHGVVGIVDVVSKNYCYAMSFKNKNVEISARVGHEGAIGILSWDGMRSNGAVLDGIPQHMAIEKGDTVYTSGYSDRFPAGIPLGKVVKKAIVSGTYYRINVELFEDCSNCRYATIVTSVDRDEIKALEGRK